MNHPAITLANLKVGDVLAMLTLLPEVAIADDGKSWATEAEGDETASDTCLKAFVGFRLRRARSTDAAGKTTTVYCAVGGAYSAVWRSAYYEALVDAVRSARRAHGFVALAVDTDADIYGADFPHDNVDLDTVTGAENEALIRAVRAASDF